MMDSFYKKAFWIAIGSISVLSGLIYSMTISAVDARSSKIEDRVERLERLQANISETYIRIDERLKNIERANGIYSIK